MTTLENSYCVPTKEQWAKIQEIEPKGYLNLIGYYQEDEVIIVEWDHIDVGNMILSKKKSEVQDRTEIPTQHFLDLVDDKPSTWRIKEYQASKGVRDGFWHIFYISQSHMISIDVDGSFNLNGRKVYLKTFTDLLTLIKFLTPPTK